MPTAKLPPADVPDVANIAPVDARLNLRRPRVIAAALSAMAGVVHLWVLPGHAEESWLYGLFFLVAGLGQLLCALFLLSLHRINVIALLGVVGNGGVLATYVLSRTVGVPLGPHAWEPEEVAGLDYTTSAAEVLLIGVLVAMLGGPSRRLAINAVFGLGVVLWVALSFGFGW